MVNDHEEYLRLKSDYSSSKETVQKEIDKLKKENDQLKKYVQNMSNNSNTGPANNINVSTNSDILNMLSEKDTKKDEIIKKYLNRIDTMNTQLNEERGKTSKCLQHIKQIEETYKTLMNDYNTIVSKTEKKENIEHTDKQINGNFK